jgi:hypothetical protein
MLKTAVVAEVASASISTAQSVKTGARRSSRAASARSRESVSMSGILIGGGGDVDPRF